MILIRKGAPGIPRSPVADALKAMESVNLVNVHASPRGEAWTFTDSGRRIALA